MNNKARVGAEVSQRMKEELKEIAKKKHVTLSKLLRDTFRRVIITERSRKLRVSR